MISPDEYAALARSRLGSVLRDKYRLDSILGIGGMATVYAATHRNDRRFAVKLMHPELSIHTGIRGRFTREGYVANRVCHPGAVTILDDDTSDDGAPFLVMELLEGMPVGQLFEYGHRRLASRVVFAMAHQVLDVLIAAHARGIVHRDIKPDNLFVLRDGRLKVLDFGIARVRDDAHASNFATRTGTMLGTPSFMAPEQAAGRASQIDARTDLWSVGATMFALLSGQAVHSGETPQHVVVTAATEPARSLAEAAPWLDSGIVAVVERALAFDPAARWPSAEAMRAAIESVYVASYGAPISLLALDAIESLPPEGPEGPLATAPHGAGGARSSLAPATPTRRASLAFSAFAPVAAAAPIRPAKAAPGAPADAAPITRVKASPIPPESAGPKTPGTAMNVAPDARPMGPGGRSRSVLAWIVAGAVALACAALFSWRRSSSEPEDPARVSSPAVSGGASGPVSSLAAPTFSGLRGPAAASAPSEDGTVPAAPPATSAASTAAPRTWSRPKTTVTGPRRTGNDDWERP